MGDGNVVVFAKIALNFAGKQGKNAHCMNKCYRIDI